MTQLLIDQLHDTLLEALGLAFPDLPKNEQHIEIGPATSEKFGHYQCNSAMRLARSLKQPPQKIAEAIVENMDRDGLESIEIAGPGFINLTLHPLFLSNRLQGVLKDHRLGIPKPMQALKIVVEFSSPNIAKEMHVGHLRSTIIGDAIARLFEYLGHNVIRLNHVGDWGTAFGMLIVYMREEVPKVLGGTQRADLSSLMHWYRESKKRFDTDPEFKTRARLAVVELQGGGEKALKAWKFICDVSRSSFQEIYDLLEVKIEERGESYYNPQLAPIVADLMKRKVAETSEGAKCIFIEGIDLPLMIEKSDGGFTYDTTDIAAMKDRVDHEKADRVIIVTDSGQSLHFKLIYEACIKAGYLDPKKLRFDHVPFGVVLGSDGKKFKTRSGETEKLIDLLKTSVKQAHAILTEKEHDLSKEEIDDLSQILGIDAVKYADLSSNRISDYIFSYDKMLRFEGNTAAFILYSYVRINGIKRKANHVDISTLSGKETISLVHLTEISLGLHLLRFGEVLRKFADDLLPHCLTDYLYQLAGKFNLFFRDCKVVGSREESSRLLLCEVAAKTMKQGLHILGLRTVERM